MRSTIVALLIVVATTSNAQVTDSQIVNTLLGVNYSKVHPTLDSLGVWYHSHLIDNKVAQGYIDRKPKVYSVENETGSIKVYFLKLNAAGVIDEIVINFSHDNKQHVEEILKMRQPTDFHVGYYSTDVVYKFRK
jgi:hypothetical protein